MFAVYAVTVCESPELGEGMDPSHGFWYDDAQRAEDGGRITGVAFTVGHSNILLGCVYQDHVQNICIMSKWSSRDPTILIY